MNIKRSSPRPSPARRERELAEQIEVHEQPRQRPVRRVAAVDTVRPVAQARAHRDRTFALELTGLQHGRGREHLRIDEPRGGELQQFVEVVRAVLVTELLETLSEARLPKATEPTSTRRSSVFTHSSVMASGSTAFEVTRTSLQPLPTHRGRGREDHAAESVPWLSLGGHALRALHGVLTGRKSARRGEETAADLELPALGLHRLTRVQPEDDLRVAGVDVVLHVPVAVLKGFLEEGEAGFADRTHDGRTVANGGLPCAHVQRAPRLSARRCPRDGSPRSTPWCRCTGSSTTRLS